jgi:DNA methylase N-4/N-6 domain protein
VRAASDAADPAGTAATDATTVFEVPRSPRNPDHPTMKPVELITRVLTNSFPPGDLVLDLFGGSGSPLIAAVDRIMEVSEQRRDSWKRFSARCSGCRRRP